MVVRYFARTYVLQVSSEGHKALSSWIMDYVGLGSFLLVGNDSLLYEVGDLDG